MTDVAVITQTQVTVVSQNVIQVVTVGIQGPQGATGAAGQGVPAGGTTGQVLAKIDGSDYNTQWVPPGSGSSVWGGITGTLSSQTDLQTALNAKQNSITTGTSSQYLRGDLSLGTFPTAVSSFTNDAGYITSAGNAATATKLATASTIAITGDVSYTSPAFDGSGNVTAAGTLATVNANTGSFGTSTAIPNFTVNAKGLITAAGTSAVIAPAGTLSGTALASGVTASSLTSFGSSIALGTPASGVLTNCTGTASGLTAGAVSTISGLISAGTNVTITGSGTSASPYAIAASGSGSSAFSSLTGGTNTSAAMVVSTGASLTISGTSQFAVSTAGALSTPSVSITGAPITGGTGTTTTPLVYLNSGASAPTTFSTSGTVLGINTPSAFAGNILDVHINGGASVLSADYQGNISTTGNITLGAGGSASGVLSVGGTSFGRFGVFSASGQIATVVVPVQGVYGWSSGYANAAANVDTFLTRAGAANIRFGAYADAASPVAQTLSVQNVLTGTSNTAGANFTITGSKGTGTGAGGSIIFQTAPAGTTGSTPNSLVSQLTINSAGLATFAGNVTAPQFYATVQTLTAGTTVSWNMASGANAKLTPAQNFTLSNPTNMLAGASGMLTITQDATGSRVITWGSAYKFPGGTKFVLSTAASAIDQIAWYTDGTNVYCVGQAAFA